MIGRAEWIGPVGRQRNNTKCLVLYIYINSCPVPNLANGVQQEKREKNWSRGPRNWWRPAGRGLREGVPSFMDKTKGEKKKGIGLDQFRRLGAATTELRRLEKESKKEKSPRGSQDGWASCQPHVVWPLRHMTRCGPSFISQELQTEPPSSQYPPSLFFFFSLLSLLSFFHPHEESFIFLLLLL